MVSKAADRYCNANEKLTFDTILLFCGNIYKITQN